MQVTQEKRPGSQVNLTITIDVDRVKKTYEKTVRDLTRNVQLQGFRRGKAPRHMVIQYLGPLRVKAAALEDLVNDSVEAAIKDADIEAIGQMEIDGGMDSLLTKFDPKTEFSFSGSVDVQPEVKLGEYTGLDITATRTLFKSEQVDETIDRYRQQRATLVPIEDRALEMGDVAIVDFEGRKADDGEAIEGATATDFQLDMDESKFIPGFVSGLVGMKPEDSREVDATFPEDYANEDVAGKDAKFSVTLHEIKSKELPELDDEFVAEISEYETLDALKAHLTESFTREADSKSFTAGDEALVDAIVESVEVDLPETLIEREIQFLIRQSLSQLSQQGLDPSQFVNDKMMEEMKERTRPDAISRLRRTLTLSAIVREENIEVGNTELQVKVEDFLNNYRGQEKVSVERVREYYKEELLTEKIFEWLKEQNSISWVDEDGNKVEAPVEAAESDVVEAEFDSEKVEEPASEATVDVSATDESDAE
ncbi:MAG: trigger factor [Cyanobacteria bacterium P01_E01_bin.34]